MRFFFCVIPAALAWMLFFLLAAAFGSPLEEASLCGLPFLITVFGLGLQVTRPHPERGESVAAECAAAQKGGA